VAGELILVVDDGKDNRDFVTQYVLEPNGFKYLTARDGQEGLEMAIEHRPDLILLDFQMPRMNGAEVLKHLSAYNLDIPVILMTFHGSEEIAIEVYRLGVKDYVKKPYYPEEMLEAIERSLSETRLRKEKEALTERVLHANRELQRRLQELNILYNVGKNVTSITDLGKLLPRIVDAAAQMSGSEEAHIYLAADGRVVCRAHRDQRNRHAQATDYEVNDPIANHILNTRQPLALGPDQLKQLGTGKKIPNSVAYAPLIHNDKPLGVLGVSNFTPNSAQFSQEDSNLLSALSDYAAIAIENSRNYEALRRSKEQVKNTFEQFVAPQVVQEALKQGDLELGGKRQEISVLFADIRGYTTWSENAPPEKVMETLNHYLSLAAEVIIGWEGTLDKFFGDGLMAIFNAPQEQADHAHRAADAALALMRAAKEVNIIHGHQLSYSVGVHSGEAVVGYVGTKRALNYTAIGDTVNLAKRLQESGAPGQIIIEQSIIDRIGQDKVTARLLGEMKVKGRKVPAIAYELVDLA